MTTLQVGDIYEEAVDNVEFGRIAAQIANKLSFKSKGCGERITIDRFRHRVGELLSGTVKKSLETHHSGFWR